MSHWAKVNDDNVVEEVLVGNNDEPDEGYSWLIENLGGRWIQTSYNTKNGVHYDINTGEPSEDQSKALRGNYAGIGFTYDESLDAFIPPKPFDSWVIDEAIFNWIPPVAYPEDGLEYSWDEDLLQWVKSV
jgi:hypothetical protein